MRVVEWWSKNLLPMQVTQKVLELPGWEGGEGGGQKGKVEGALNLVSKEVRRGWINFLHVQARQSVIDGR